MTIKEQLIQLLQNNLKSIAAGHERFIKTFQKDPNHALDWAESTFENAAEETVTKMTLIYLENHDIKQAREYCTQNALRNCLSPLNSSSTASNLVKAKTAEAWSRMASTLKYNE